MEEDTYEGSSSSSSSTPNKNKTAGRQNQQQVRGMKRKTSPKILSTEVQENLNQRYRKGLKQYIQSKKDEAERFYELKFPFWKNICDDVKKRIIYQVGKGAPSKRFSDEIGIPREELLKLMRDMCNIESEFASRFAKDEMKKMTEKQTEAVKNAFNKYPHHVGRFENEISGIKLSDDLKQHIHFMLGEEARLNEQILTNYGGKGPLLLQNQKMALQGPSCSSSSVADRSIDRDSTHFCLKPIPGLSRLDMHQSIVNNKYEKDVDQFVQSKTAEMESIYKESLPFWKNVSIEIKRKLVSFWLKEEELTAEGTGISSLDLENFSCLKNQLHQEMHEEFAIQEFEKITIKQKNELQEAFNKCSYSIGEFLKEARSVLISTHLKTRFHFTANKDLIRNKIKANVNGPAPNGQEMTANQNLNSPAQTESSRATTSSPIKDGAASYALEEHSEPQPKIARYDDAHENRLPEQPNSPGLSQPEGNEIREELGVYSEQNAYCCDRGVEFENPTTSEDTLGVDEVPVHQNNRNFEQLMENNEPTNHQANVVETASSSPPDETNVNLYPPLDQDFEARAHFEQSCEATYESSNHSSVPLELPEQSMERSMSPVLPRNDVYEQQPELRRIITPIEEEEDGTVDRSDDDEVVVLYDNAMPEDQHSNTEENDAMEDMLMEDVNDDADNRLPDQQEFENPTESEQPVNEPSTLHAIGDEVINDPLEAPNRPDREGSHFTEYEQPVNEPSVLHGNENAGINNDLLEEVPNRQEGEESPDIIYMGTDAYTGPAPRPAPSIQESQRKPRLVPESILTRIPDGATEEWELWTREQVLQWSSLFLDTEGQRFYMKKKNFTGVSMAEFLDKKDWDDFDSRSPINGIYISLRANLNRIINHRNGWTFD